MQVAACGASLLMGCNEHTTTAASDVTSRTPGALTSAEPERQTPSDEAPAREVPAGWPGARPPGVTPHAEESSAACEVEVFSSVVEAPDGHWDVIARARNRTPRPLTLTLPKVCTGGPVEFAGIPRYDYYGRCAQGACPRAPEGRSEVRVEPRGIVELSRGRVDPKGNSCNAPVPPGRYPALVAVDLQGAVVCLGPSDVMDLNPAAPTTAPAPPAAPRKVKPAPEVAPAPRKCPPQPACGIACPGGEQKRDENGCTLCACEEEFGPRYAPAPPPKPVER